jgi:hypothetical protein
VGQEGGEAKQTAAKISVPFIWRDPNATFLFLALSAWHVRLPSLLPMHSFSSKCPSPRCHQHSLFLLLLLAAVKLFPHVRTALPLFLFDSPFSPGVDVVWASTFVLFFFLVSHKQRSRLFLIIVFWVLWIVFSSHALLSRLPSSAYWPVMTLSSPRVFPLHWFLSLFFWILRLTLLFSLFCCRCFLIMILVGQTKADQQKKRE